MLKYIHIGYPKCFSTTLQRSFFDAHPDILHLGIGCGSNVGYADAHLAAYMENYLIYARHFAWMEEEAAIKAHFNQWFSKAADDGYVAVGISLEHIVFSFTTDNIDTREKALRLRDIFLEDTRILMVVRNQLDLLKSLYRESVRTGNPGSFNDYLQFCVFLKDRNFVYDFRYDLVYDLYSELFGQQNICVLVMEELRDADGHLVRDADGKSLLSSQLLNFLDLNANFEVDGHFNIALSNETVERKVHLNKEFRHDLGNDMYGRGVSFHRLNDYLNLTFPSRLSEAFIHADVITKRASIQKASESTLQAQPQNQYDQWLWDYLDEFYISGNRQFERQINRVLPAQFFGLTTEV